MVVFPWLDYGYAEGFLQVRRTDGPPACAVLGRAGRRQTAIGTDKRRLNRSSLPRASSIALSLLYAGTLWRHYKDLE
jgi:hypothetical protein